MSIQFTPDAVTANIKVQPAGPYNDTNLANQVNIDMSNPAAQNVVMYQLLPITPNPSNLNAVYLGIINVTTEWLMALIQDQINEDLQFLNGGKYYAITDTIPAGIPQIPITGQWDCITQQAMVIEYVGEYQLSAAPTGHDQVQDLGPQEFGYILSISVILNQLIQNANGGANFGATYSPQIVIAAPPQAAAGTPLLPDFNGAKASQSCVGNATSANCQANQTWDMGQRACVSSTGPGLNPNLTKTGDTTGGGGGQQPAQKSYFWPIVGGLTAGVVVIGGGYYLMKGDKSKSTISS